MRCFIERVVTNHDVATDIKVLIPDAGLRRRMSRVIKSAVSTAMEALGGVEGISTLDGIITHNGEFEMHEYRPVDMPDFATFDAMVESCYVDESNIIKIVPSTLEGCVVRVCDIIAYLGKDRQDAILAKAAKQSDFTEECIGTINAEIVNNLIVNVIENSYGKPYIKLDKAHFDALKRAKAENYAKIYNRAGAITGTEGVIKPMMENVYGQLLDDVKNGAQSSPIFKHHIAYINKTGYAGKIPYEKQEPNQLVVDYIASMTDDYFIELHQLLFKNSPYKVTYRGYFDE